MAVAAGAGAETLDGRVRPFAGCYFDAKAADKVVRFFKYLKHSKGEWAGHEFKLEHWQVRILRAAFGWMQPDGTRLIRTIYIEVPRKNGKSTFAAGIGLYLTIGDGEPGAEVYSAAMDKEQAQAVFGEAKRMAEASVDLSRVCTIFKTSIYAARSGSSYKVLAKPPTGGKGKHGLNVHGLIFDELHEQPNRELFDVLTTAQGSRRQPLTVLITTAGFDRNSICWEQHDYAEKVNDGIIEDPSFLGVIFAAGEKDDWHSETTWAKANPNFGVSVKINFLRTEHKKACESPGRENVFKRLYLNIWTEQESRWLSLDAWDGCEGDGPIHADQLAGRKCWGGLDLSNTADIACLLWVFPTRLKTLMPGHELEEEVEVYDILPRLWLPADSADKRLRNNRVPYPTWASRGHITLTPGNVIDHEFIKRQILEDFGKFQVQEIAYDPFNAVQLCAHLHNDHGLPMLEHRQGYLSMNSPTKALEAMVLSRRIRHGGHPVLRWAAGNVVVSQDPSGNLKPNKEKAFEKIDPIVSLIMALGRAVLQEGGTPYNERGLVVL